MSNTPILNQIEDGAEVIKTQRQPSKALSVKDKNKMCSIMGFILYLKETGKLDEESAKEMMEELPLYSTAKVQIEYFAQEVFDLKKVELELWKPMVVEHKLNKKNEKNEKKKNKEEQKLNKSKKEKSKNGGF